MENILDKFIWSLAQLKLPKKVTYGRLTTYELSHIYTYTCWLYQLYRPYFHICIILSITVYHPYFQIVDSLNRLINPKYPHNTTNHSIIFPSTIPRFLAEIKQNHSKFPCFYRLLPILAATFGGEQKRYHLTHQTWRSNGKIDGVP